MAHAPDRVLGLLLPLEGELRDDARLLEPRAVGPDWLLFPLAIDDRALTAADVGDDDARNAVALGLAYRSWLLLRAPTVPEATFLPPLRALDGSELAALPYAELVRRSAARTWTTSRSETL